jgi:hypothetical protein
LLDSPPSVDSTGDFLTLVSLRDPANISPNPAARAASPTPSSTSTATSPVFSVTSTASVASPSPTKCLRLDSLFNTRRGYHIPLVSLTERKHGTLHDAPPAPTPVSLGPADWRSWLGGLVGLGSVTGGQIDALCTWWSSLRSVSFLMYVLKWRVLTGLYRRRNLNPTIHKRVTPSGKRGRARRGRRPRQLPAQRIIYTIDYTLLLQNEGRWLAHLFIAHANS